MDATIASFHEPLLELSIDGQANGKDLLSYLRATPVGAEHVDYLRGLGIGGKGVVHIDLDVPLKHSEDMTLDGYVDLSAARLDESTWGLHFTEAKGRVRILRDGVLADALDTRLDGMPVSLGIAIGSSAKDKDNSFEASLRGVLPATTVFAKATDLAPAMASFPGQADWNIDLAIGSDAGPAKGRKALRLQSNLEGIAINLPAPLGKPAATSLPFELQLEMPLIGQPFSASLGDILQIGGRLPGPDLPLAARLDLGPATASNDVPASGLLIGGHAKSLDAGGWIGLFNTGSGGGELLQGVHVTVDELLMAGRSFANLSLALVPDGEALKIDITGDFAAGQSQRADRRPAPPRHNRADAARALAGSLAWQRRWRGLGRYRAGLDSAAALVDRAAAAGCRLAWRVAPGEFPGWRGHAHRSAGSEIAECRPPCQRRMEWHSRRQSLAHGGRADRRKPRRHARQLRVCRHHRRWPDHGAYRCQLAGVANRLCSRQHDRLAGCQRAGRAHPRRRTRCRRSPVRTVVAARDPAPTVA
ncbi:MAG: hypothetical protein IPH43_02985 [Xanthomonadales bacterium]|nr:hypothetical protein [Xanthomonadales bacterium]